MPYADAKYPPRSELNLSVKELITVSAALADACYEIEEFRLPDAEDEDEENRLRSILSLRDAVHCKVSGFLQSQSRAPATTLNDLQDRIDV